ncbi:cobalt-precorrin-6A reductase [Amycolatopsis sp. AA4]|uniref:cobalt-precorrin-6A reductase n=1 Tax=Actinomycetes TaxID=1760 RepID=UPI0001B53B04|nr:MULTISPECIES: cobalt-precorrin-6A reductase [Actinomycetes]ATY16666.1 cobalt-precorrin-6A reductase [Amycolatopsis sp. AA4]EFL09950.1 precorrin-6x reductase CbiJ/CobK [Streptomyces sp. AA4]
MTVLILGGTAEARDLAAQLHERAVPVVSSLAGRVTRPRLPVGEVRIGGFGGVEGLTAWLRENGVRAVVDATHPFAERIGANAFHATQAAGIPLLRLARPGWQPSADDRWHWADDLEEAAALLPGLGTRVFLTSGRQGLAAFADLDPLWFLIRCVDPPGQPLPRAHEVVLDRGPHRVDGERALMTEHDIDVLVTKDSGGAMTAAKLTAARELGLPVVIVRRPPRPSTTETADVAAAVEWVLNQ